MRAPKWGLAGLVALAGVAFWMLLAGPDQTLGIDLGGFGLGLMTLLAWLGVHGITAAPRGELDDAMSPGEWRGWVGLGFTVLAGAYLLAKADQIVGATELRDLGRIGRNLVLLLVSWAVVSQVLRWRWKGKVLEDERDREIEVRAAAWARGALVLMVIGIVLMLGLSPSAKLAWATHIAIAHLLVFAMVWHSLVEYAVVVISYWRDRRP